MRLDSPVIHSVRSFIFSVMLSPFIWRTLAKCPVIPNDGVKYTFWFGWRCSFHPLSWFKVSFYPSSACLFNHRSCDFHILTTALLQTHIAGIQKMRTQIHFAYCWRSTTPKWYEWTIHISSGVLVVYTSKKKSTSVLNHPDLNNNPNTNSGVWYTHHRNTGYCHSSLSLFI